jgi:hypothetical protein
MIFCYETAPANEQEFAKGQHFSGKGLTASVITSGVMYGA